VDDPDEPPPDLPPDFSEEFLLANYVPVYMQLEEHVLYAPAKPIPCGGPRPSRASTSTPTDTPASARGVTEQGSLGSGSSNAVEWGPTQMDPTSFRGNNNSRTQTLSIQAQQQNARAANQVLDGEFDQGLLDGYLPKGINIRHVDDPFMSYPLDLSPHAIRPKHGKVVEVTFSGPTDTEWEGRRETYRYQTIQGVPLGKEHAALSPSNLDQAAALPIEPPVPVPGPSSSAPTSWHTRWTSGTYHDPDVCPGCKIREEEGAKARRLAEERTNFDHMEEDTDVVIWDSIGLGRSRSASGSQVSLDSASTSSSSLSESFIDDPDGPEGPAGHDLDHIPPCPGVIDVLITGVTPERHGNAWNPYKYTGRVRLHDGLIGILRSDPNATQNGLHNPLYGGKVVFFGYIHGGRNFVGTWRIVGNGDIGVPGYEGPFTFGRRE
jgi:hypothetical protein